MAPAKAQKRAAQESKTAGGKKARATKDPLTNALEALVNSAELPTSCREMLLLGIAPSLDTKGQPRHEIQELMVTMLDELIVAAEANHRDSVEKAAATEAAAQAIKAELAERLTQANAELSAKAQIVDEKNAALTASGENVDKATAALEEQKELQRVGDAKNVETQGVKASVVKGIEVDYVKIIEGTGNCDELLPVLKTLGADESLIQALPSTCAKSPGDRGAFDTMVLDQLNQHLKKKLGELTQVLDGEAAGVEERASAVAAAEKLLAEMKAAQSLATEAHTAADSQMQDASAVVSAVKAEVKTHEQAVKTATRAHTSAVAEQQVFQHSTREPFDALRSAEPTVVAEEKTMDVDATSEATVNVGGA